MVAGSPGLRFAAWEVQSNPGAREVVGSNPTDPTITLPSILRVENGKLRLPLGLFLAFVLASGAPSLNSSLSAFDEDCDVVDDYSGHEFEFLVVSSC